MAKLIVQNYYTRKGIEKINCFHLLLKKDLVERLGWNKNTELVIKVVNDKVVVEKA